MMNKKLKKEVALRVKELQKILNSFELISCSPEDELDVLNHQIISQLYKGFEKENIFSFIKNELNDYYGITIQDEEANEIINTIFIWWNNLSKTKTIGIYTIHETFKITGRGIVFAGKLTSGIVKTNAIIEFKFNNEILQRTLSGFDLGMRVQNPKGINHGLLIKCKNEKEIIDFQKWKPNKVEAKIIEILSE